MLSKAKIKFVRSLQLKKFRQKYGYYTAEGSKIINELLRDHSEIHTIYGSENWIDQFQSVLSNIETVIVDEKELKKISSFSTPQQALAVVAIPEKEHAGFPASGLHLALDDISDPGNMGTIIRSADWFGVQSIYCSDNCVDIYNPKVVQAAMGSVGRVPVFTSNLADVITGTTITTLGTVLGGKSIKDANLSKDSLIVVGNESRGIDPSISELCDELISIDRSGMAESLNAAVATGIMLYAVRASN